VSYDIHITKAEHWTLSKVKPITESDLFKAEEILKEYNSVPFIFRDGRITLCGADERVIGLMIKIATRINARVQGDDGEYYEDVNNKYPIPTPSLFQDINETENKLSHDHKKTIASLKVGDNIEHPQYGAGQIVEIQGEEDDVEFLVKFENLFKPKRLLANYAPIKPINFP
jgi:hypothetical protein